MTSWNLKIDINRDKAEGVAVTADPRTVAVSAPYRVTLNQFFVMQPILGDIPGGGGRKERIALEFVRDREGKVKRFDWFEDARAACRNTTYDGNEYMVMGRNGYEPHQVNTFWYDVSRDEWYWLAPVPVAQYPLDEGMVHIKHEEPVEAGGK